jgi:hypothetical protein
MHVHRLRTLASLAAATIGAVGLSSCNVDAGTGLWLRDFDPVVLQGSGLPDLIGTDPDDIVAFRYDTQAGAWDQVPVQVDERHLEHLTQLRNGTGSTGPMAIAYSDPAANAGADPVATFDADDEVAFMADDTGGEAPSGAARPTGVVAGSGVEVTVTDPLTPTNPLRGSGTGLVYLFVRSGALSPAAGDDYVDYEFGPVDPMGHAESSTVSTDRYATHFSSRWARDRLHLGGGPDLLDRHRNQFALGVCGRSEDTFSAGDGGYATNVDGPVRAIRSYLGANSGTYTQREHIFYRGTERVQTFLRVHAIPGIMDFYDYSGSAIGMRYRSSNTPGGVVIDGIPDAMPAAAPTWEAVTGAPGALVSVSTVETDIAGMGMQSYYSDDSTPATTQCTGDAFEYGASGTRITTPIPNTDPAATGTVHTFTGTRWNVYLGPGEPVSTDLHVANMSAPLAASAGAWP